MSSAENVPEVLRLFSRYKEAYDVEDKFAAPADSIGVADLWRALERQLKLDTNTIAQQIAELGSLPVHSGDSATPESLIRRLPKTTADAFLLVPVAIEGDEPMLAIATSPQSGRWCVHVSLQ